MIRLHHCHQTRSMRTLWLLHELGCDFEVQTYPFDDSQRSAAYRALHPAMRVPSLEIDGAVLWETGAIAQVLCERFPDSEMGREVGHPERADWLVWVHFAETMRAHAANLTQQHVMLFEDSMRSPIITKLEARRLSKCYQVVSQYLDTRGGKAGSLLASGFSAADVAIGQAVYMGRHFAKLEPYPALSAWYHQITERPAFQLSLPPEGEEIYAQAYYPELPV